MKKWDRLRVGIAKILEKRWSRRCLAHFSRSFGGLHCQQFQEEIGVVLVERSQPLGNDPDGTPVRSRHSPNRHAVLAKDDRSHSFRRTLGYWLPRQASTVQRTPADHQAFACLSYIDPTPAAKGLLANSFQVPGNPVVKLPRRFQTLAGDQLEHLVPLVSREGSPSGEHPIQLFREEYTKQLQRCMDFPSADWISDARAFWDGIQDVSRIPCAEITISGFRQSFRDNHRIFGIMRFRKCRTHPWP